MANEDIFEPYFDWDKISEQMLDDTHEATVMYARSRDRFLAQKTKANLAAFLSSQQTLSKTALLVEQAIFVVPTMIHIADEPIEGEDEDGDKTITQACQRCKRVLMLWTANQVVYVPGHGGMELLPEHLNWWSKGDRIALTKDQKNSYIVPDDRELKPYEHPCPDFGEMFNG